MGGKIAMPEREGRVLEAARTSKELESPCKRTEFLCHWSVVLRVWFPRPFHKVHRIRTLFIVTVRPVME